VVCIAAIFLIVVGLPYISLCHQTIAERLDNEMDKKFAVDGWIGVGGASRNSNQRQQERKTSMSSLHSCGEIPNPEEDLDSPNEERTLKTKMISSMIHFGISCGLLRIEDEDQQKY
jgi:hypothetical protein